jgi:hypothetical protein
MRFLSLFLGILSVATVCGAEKIFDFGAFASGELPPGFRSTVTGKGKPGDWKVIYEDAPTAFPATSPKTPSTSKRAVLAQVSRDLTDDHYPLLIAEDEIYGDFVVTTKIKMVSGVAEQMAGIAFRVKDEKNYYYVRASALGNTIRFYKFVDGALGPPVSKEVLIKKDVWHDLKLEVRGTQIDVFFDEQRVWPTITDTSFPQGKLGFWTKSDSVSYFADTKVIYTPREPLAVIIVRELMQHQPRLKGVRVFAPLKQGGVGVIASDKPGDLGLKGAKVEEDVLARNATYYGKAKNAIVTLPLHDRNGEVVAAVRFELESFLGQTEQNAVARAMPLIQEMEKRLGASKDLLY